MNVTFAAPLLAPTPTGHPASLPPDPGVSRPNLTVTAQDSSGKTGFHAFDREQGSAPPSILQIKIMEILEQQARELGLKAGTDGNREAP